MVSPVTSIFEKITWVYTLKSCAVHSPESNFASQAAQVAVGVAAGMSKLTQDFFVLKKRQFLVYVALI